MRYRSAAWILLCTCGALLVLLQWVGPIWSSDPAFAIYCYTGAVALPLGAIAGAYLFLGYFGRWASKA